MGAVFRRTVVTVLGLAVAAAGAASGLTACGAAETTTPTSTSTGTAPAAATPGSPVGPPTTDGPPLGPSEGTLPCEAGSVVVTGDTALTARVGDELVLGARTRGGSDSWWSETLTGTALAEAGSGSSPCGSNTPDLVGRDEVNTFTFAAVAPGPATVVLTERNADTGEQSASYTVTVTVS